MAIFGGADNRIMAGKETTYGTKVTANKTIGLLQGGVSIEQTNNLTEFSGHGHRKTQFIVTGKYGVTGSFDYLVNEGSFPYFTLGSYNASSPVAATPYAGVYKHIIDGSDTVRIPSFTFSSAYENAAADKQVQVAGCKVASQSFNAALDTPLTSSVSFVGSTIDISGTTAGTVTEFTPEPYTMHSPGTIIETGTDTVQTKITAIDATITNTLAAKYGASTRTIRDLLCPEQRIAGNMTLYFEDYTEVEKFLSSGASPTIPIASGNVKEFDTTITFANEAIGSASAAYRGITLELTSCKFNTNNFTFNQTDANEITLGYIAKTGSVYYYDVTSTDYYA